MLTSTQNMRLSEDFGVREAIRIIADAGFDAYDMSLHKTFALSDDPLNGDGWREEAVAIRKYADEIGIVCNQAHAVYPPVKGDASDADRYRHLIRHMEIASVLGAKLIVVHPIQYLYYHKNVQTLKEMNLDFYRGLLPYCEKFKIKIGIENMWRRYYGKSGNRITDSVCSRAEEFCEYVDLLDSPWIAACLDVGHVALVGEDMTRMIRMLGSRLQALHVHDNDTSADLHTLPFQSRIDFEEVTQALAEVNYGGDLTLEADSFYGSLTPSQPDLYRSAAKHMCAVAKNLRSRIEEKRK